MVRFGWSRGTNAAPDSSRHVLPRRDLVMGVFDWLSRRRPVRPAGNLRDALIDAVSAQQYDVMAELTNANADTIREEFPKWTTVPKEIRDDPEALERYSQTLIAVAAIFERSGDDSLMTRLTRGDLIAQWRDDLVRADALIEQKRAAEAVRLLQTILSSLDEVRGSAVQSYRPIVLGRLGIALLHTGDKREAVRVTKEALALCHSRGDAEGIRAYTHNLNVIGTYEVPANDDTNGNVTVAFTDEEGHTLTLDELRKVSGTVRWEVRGGAPVPPDAERLHQEGRAAGARDDYDEAESLLTRAAERAPSWPYPVYDRAFTHLLREDFDAALNDYRRTLELAPGGFFTAEVAVDTLTRESTGEFRRGLYAAFAMLEHMPADQRCSIAGQLVEQCPSFAPGWNEYADCVTDLDKRLQVIERGLAARPDPHTRGLLMVKKAMTMSWLGNAGGASAMLRQLASDSTSVHTRVLADFVLSRLSSNHPAEAG
jgi:tetratricopeptide (TPR) repeat protein